MKYFYNTLVKGFCLISQLFCLTTFDLISIFAQLYKELNDDQYWTVAGAGVFNLRQRAEPLLNAECAVLCSGLNRHRLSSRELGSPPPGSHRPLKDSGKEDIIVDWMFHNVTPFHHCLYEPLGFVCVFEYWPASRRSLESLDSRQGSLCSLTDWWKVRILC